PQIGDANVPGRALQEPDPEEGLKLRHAFTDGGSGQAQLAGGCGETAAFCHPDEGVETIKPVHDSFLFFALWKECFSLYHSSHLYRQELYYVVSNTAHHTTYVYT